MATIGNPPTHKKYKKQNTLTSEHAFLDFSICFVSESEEYEFPGNSNAELGVFEVEGSGKEAPPFPLVPAAAAPLQPTWLLRDFFGT